MKSAFLYLCNSCSSIQYNNKVTGYSHDNQAATNHSDKRLCVADIKHQTVKRGRNSYGLLVVASFAKQKPKR
jgi:hypothetical protein